MNEKDIQRKIDLQLAHLRNEFNERLQTAELKIQELEERLNKSTNKKEATNKKKATRFYFRYFLNEDRGFYRIVRLWTELLGSGCIDRGHIHDFLECFTGEERLFPPFTIEWLKSDSLAIYLIDQLKDNKWIDDQNLDTKIEAIFDIKNPAQKRSNYWSKNKNQRPQNHVIIDNIISELQTLSNVIDEETFNMGMEFSHYKMNERLKARGIDVHIGSQESYISKKLKE